MALDQSAGPALLLVGAGNMGGALLEGWLAAGAIDVGRSAVVDPNPSDRLLELTEAHGIALNPVQDKGYDIAVLAVKPQLFPDVLPRLHWPGAGATLFVSIAAGVTVRQTEQLLAGLSEAPKVIRTMPNLPVAYGKGATLLTAGGAVAASEKEAAKELFSAVGTVVETETEDGLDRLMGISGCGPAYVFLMAEALEEAALSEGATAAEARALAEMTVVGAAHQMSEDGRPASDLRASVTSKGGTTAAALSVLDAEGAGGFRERMKEAVRAAYTRGQELMKGAQ